MKHSLSTFVSSMNGICPIPENLSLELLLTPERMVVPRDTILLQPGGICDYLYYIEEGLLGSYETHDEKRRYKWLMVEGDLATAVASFNTRVPSTETIVALEPCILYKYHWQQLEDTSDQYRPFAIVRQRLTDKYHIQCREMYEQMQRGTDHFYAYLVKDYPELVTRVQLYILASFMGITPPTLYSAIERHRQLIERHRQFKK